MERTVKEEKISDLLTYLPDYGVLLCRSCRFAVQPTAFSSHLLRHQIYRNERRQLLERLNTLTIGEPDEVGVPPPSARPIPGLALSRGLACAAPGCSHCCASEKRMAQHWSLVHHKPNAQDVEARNVYLQTFFRGNKNRYFEVTPDETESLMEVSEEAASPASQPAEFKDVLREFRRGSTPGQPSRAAQNEYRGRSPLPSDPIQRFGQVDMLPLKLLYHWSTYTSATLNRGTESLSFWGHEALQIAFQHEFVMQGILSVTAYHLMRRTRDPVYLNELHDAGFRYISEGLASYRRILNHPPTTENAAACIAFGRLLSVQRCAESQFLIGNCTPHDESNVAPLLERFFLLRGAVQLLVQCQDRLAPDSDLRLTPQALVNIQDNVWQQRMELESMGGKDSFVLPPLSWFPNLRQDVYEQILTIPLKITLLAPDTNPRSIEAVEDATLALLTAFNRSHESADMSSLWNGVDSWVYALPDPLTEEFIGLMKGRHSGLLFLFAHWCLLLRRLEPNCWFLEGQANALLRIVVANLEGEPKRMISEFIPGYLSPQEGSLPNVP